MVICYISIMTARPSDRSTTKTYGESGYPAIEKLIDTEEFDVLNAAFEDAYMQLQEVSSRKKGFKTQREAAKVMKTLELTLDLLRELLALKYRLQETSSESPRKGH
jgi:hypothetical protein